MRTNRGWVVLGALLLSATATTTARAQGWIKLPNGGLGYMTDYTTTGMFQCAPRYLKGTCFTSGNSITMSGGASTVTFSFEGVSKTVTATSRPQPTLLGKLMATWSGIGPRMFPRMQSPATPLFYFSIGIATTSPFAAAGTLRYKFWTRPYNLHGARAGAPYAYLPTVPAPPPARYSLKFYDQEVPQITTDFESMDIHSQVAIAPEPATLLLFASGVAGLAGVMRRRKSSGTPPAEGL